MNHNQYELIQTYFQHSIHPNDRECYCIAEILQLTFAYASSESIVMDPMHCIKQEIINECVIANFEFLWARTENKARMSHRYLCHKYITSSDGTLLNALFGIDIRWSKGQKISKQEMFVLRLYLDFDCIRLALNNCSIIEQSSKFFHIRRQLLIIAAKFGTKAKYDTPLFVTLNGQIAATMAAMAKTAVFYSPISGTNLLNAAIRASEMQDHKILQLKPRFPNSDRCRVFDVRLISDYPETQTQIISMRHVEVEELQTEVHSQLV